MQNTEWIDRIRTPFLMAVIVLMTILLGVVAIIVSFVSRNGNTPHLIARLWGKVILLVCGIKVRIRGISNVDPTKSYIFMSNHQGNFDIPVLLGCLPFQFRWLAKAELFRIPLFGRAMRGCGYISIDRFNQSSAFESLSRAAATVQNGVNLMIFPEGTRSLDGNIRPFKKGSFILTIDAGVPIIPIIIHGTYSIMPKNRWLIKPGGVLLEILEPVETSGYAREDKDILIEKIRNIICDSFGKGIKEN